jgi:ABC-type amino acid transport substrate-binding protein
MKVVQQSVFIVVTAWTHWIKPVVIISIILLTNPASIRSQPKSLIIAVEDDAAPWSKADGTGYANDVVIAAFKAVGVDAQLRVVPYARCKRMAVNGTVAGCFSMSPSPELDGVIELSARPLFTPYSGYFFNVNKPPAVTRQEDLPPKTVVGTVIGYEYPSAFNKLIQTGVVVPEESPSEVINLKKLALGRVDLAILNYDKMKSPKWLITRAGVNGNVKPTFRAGVLKSYIGFSNKNPQGAWARLKFNKGYRLITTNGTLRRIRSMWLQKLDKEKAASRR